MTKLAPADSVLVAIRRVLAGEIYVSEATATRLVTKLVAGPGAAASTDDPDAPPDLSRLSDREFEVFCLMGRGVGPSEIAARLGVSVKTIETHQDHLKRKLKARSARDLWRIAAAHAADPGAAPQRGGRRPDTDPA